MLWRRLAYPCRYSDMIPRFGRSKPEICLIVHTVLRYISTQFEHLLSSFLQKGLHLDNLTEYAVAVHNKCHATDNCWGFIDGTVRPICRPGENQRVVYNGHKRVHALEYQSVINSSVCEVIAFSNILMMIKPFEVKNIWLQETRSIHREIFGENSNWTTFQGDSRLKRANRLRSLKLEVALKPDLNFPIVT